MSIISFKNVYLKQKRKSTKNILENINLEIERGEFIYLTGPIGAGKTSLLRLIYMDVLPDAGEVIVDEFSSETIKPRKIPLLRRELGIIFQDFRLLKDRNINDNLLFVLQVTDTPSDEIPDRIQKALKQVGLLHKQYELPSSLSSGEQQRVAIARAIIREPKIILADEPTANLDRENTNEVIALLQELNKQYAITIIVITHNNDIIYNYPARTYLLDDMKLIEVEVSESN